MINEISAATHAVRRAQPAATVSEKKPLRETQSVARRNPSVSSLHSCLGGVRGGRGENSKQLLARRVASIRWWIERSGAPPRFLHLSPCVNQPLCHSPRQRGGGIMSSYLFCSKMKYLSGVNTYQEQTIGQGASSSQTHIWLPPPQRPNHVLRVFSDSGKSASFESTFQRRC